VRTESAKLDAEMTILVPMISRVSTNSVQILVQFPDNAVHVLNATSTTMELSAVVHLEWPEILSLVAQHL
jgi:hypothetical protein